MTNSWHFYTLLLSSLFTGCASIESPQRVPSSTANQDTIQDLVSIQNNQTELAELRLQLENLRIPAVHVNSGSIRGPNTSRFARDRALRQKRDLEQRIQQLQNQNQNLTQNLAPALALQTRSSSLSFRVQNPHFKLEELVIDDTDLLKSDHANRSVFIYENIDQKKYAIELSSSIFKSPPPRQTGRGIPSARNRTEHLDATLECDGEVLLSKSYEKIKGTSSRSVSFKLIDQLRSSGRHYLFLSPEAKSCILEASNPRTGSRHTVELKRNNTSPAAELAAFNEVCLLKKPTSKMSAAEKLFNSSEFSNFSCPRSVPEPELYPDPLDGINAKIEMLTGKKVPRSEIEKADPYLKLDFSEAPHLDAIYVSALVFRADFSGVLMSRLLEFHAKRGTEVKLFISKPTTLKKDKAFLERFPKEYPNFKIQLFKYPGSWSRGFGDVIQGLHRVNHIKALVTLSKAEPEHNQIIIGGRNYHDGFIFHSAPDHSKHPFMVTYGKDESFIHWADLEMKIRSREAAVDVAIQILGVWNRDNDTAAFHTPFVQVPIAESQYKVTDLDSSQAKIRSFFSGPYRDEHALEEFFVKMIGTAQKSIITVSPYLRLTERIVEAMEQAALRGVKIKIYTRIDLSGDTAAALMSDVNKNTINKLNKNVEIYEWTKQGSILHTKTMIIDDEITFLGGVNLNKRSFIHDWENGILVWDKTYNSNMRALAETYNAGSREVTEEQKMRWWTGFIINLLDDKL